MDLEWGVLASVLQAVWILVCLTVSIYGGNEHGKMEQFIEYKKKYGADAAKKKLKEWEAKRDKDKNTKKAPVPKKTAAATPPSPNKTPVSKAKDVETKKEKKKLVETLGLSSKSKKTKKKPSNTAAQRELAPKHADEVYIEDVIRRASGEVIQQALVEVKLSDILDGSRHNSPSLHKSSSATTSASTSTETTSSRKVQKKKPLKDKAAVPNNRDQMPLTAREHRPSKKTNTETPLVPAVVPGMVPRPPVFSLPSNQRDKDEDEFTPTVFEVIKAPLRPFVEKLENNSKGMLIKSGAGTRMKQTKKPEEAVSPVVDATEHMKLVKEKLKKKHQKMVQQQTRAQIKKLSKESPVKKEKDQNNVGIIGEAVSTLKTKRSKKKKRRKKKQRLNADGNPICKTSSGAYSETSKDSSKSFTDKSPETSARTSTAGTGSASAKSDFGEDAPTQCDSLEEQNEDIEEDKTDSDKDVLADVKKQTTVSALRKVNSAREHKEKVENVKATDSWRPFGHQVDNPRMKLAEIKALARPRKSKKTKKKSSTEKTDAQITAEEPAPDEYPAKDSAPQCQSSDQQH